MKRDSKVGSLFLEIILQYLFIFHTLAKSHIALLALVFQIFLVLIPVLPNSILLQRLIVL